MVTGDGYGRWLREKALGLLRSLGFLHFFLYFLHFVVFGVGYGRWLREKALGLLRSLGVLHFFLYFSNFSIFFLYLGMVTGDGYGRRLWAYYVVLVFFISSCIFFICLEFGDGYGRWLREMVTGEDFGPTT